MAEMYKDIPVVAWFARYTEDYDSVPSAIIAVTSEGKTLVIPFTGNQTYTDYLGGNKLIRPQEPVVQPQPVIDQISSTEMSGTSLPNKDIEVEVKEDKKVTVRTDEYGSWKIPIEPEPEEPEPLPEASPPAGEEGDTL